MPKPINVTRSSMPSFEEYCEEIRPLWESRFLTNMGEKHLRLEEELKRYLGAENITLFTNGHLALENIITALNLHGEIITTPFTFASTTHAIVRCGCTPVFCDIDPQTYTIDVSLMESLITDKTVAILPVHVYGNLCDTEAIASIAARHHLKVIYDAAHAFGVVKNGVSAACFGDASMFSFHATKVFHTIEGGAVCYGDSSLCTKLNDLKKIRKREAVHAHYFSRLDDVPGIRLSPVQPGVKSNYAYFPVLFDGYRYNRDEIYDLLAAQNIIARKYFYPLTTAFDCYRGRPGFDVSATPVAQHTAQHVLCLPMYADLSPEDVDRICDIILG